MSLPLWMPLVFVVWALVLLRMYVLVSRWQGTRRTAAMKLVVFLVAGSLVAAIGIVTLYARNHSVAGSANKPQSDCDKPPAPAPTPPTTPAKPDTAAASNAAPNFLTFAACSDGAKPQK